MYSFVGFLLQDILTPPQPDDATGTEDCAVMHGPQYYLHDYDCADSLRVFCQAPMSLV